METRERQHSHRTTSGGGSELFICFTSRPSSTSCAAAMRVPSSKSLMSPGRAAAPSLSSSLSRRLRSSGSVKGGEQSPMFPAGVTARKKGCAFEAAEPSSPKVTCIGQVRVKSKKKKNKCKAEAGAAMVRSRSQRRSGGEASFRRAVGGEGERECKPWGITVCEALRSFGSEINCFVPCRGGTGRSLCSSSKSSCEEEKRTRSSCGAVFARWMMAVQEGEEGKGGEVVGLVVQESGRREVGLMVGKEEEEDVKVEEEEEKVVVVKKEVEVEVEVEVVDEGRGSVCVPPKNALLLMRCRSDPVRMAALATRFWGSPNAAKVGAEEVGQTGEEAEEEEEEEEDVRVETIAEEKEEGGEELGEDLALVAEEVAEEAIAENENRHEQEEVCEDLEANAEEQEDQQNKCEDLEANAEEEMPKDESFTADSTESPAVPLKEEVKVKEEVKEKRRRSRVKDREMRRSRSSKEKERKRNSFSSEREARRHSFSTEREARRPSISMETERRQSWSFSVVREEKKENKEEENRNKALDSEKACKVEGEKKRELPDCLLLMMYEPKLSMEVSKETWVCSTDFLQWRPKEVVPAGAAAAAAADETQDPVPPLSEEVEKKLFGAPDPAPVPAAAPVAYEPFVLTRCKSEPMRSSARLAPDACFWKSRHQPIGAAGIGF
ncbi:hypothetical protein J5N97_010565 [Dioscorea zingiberensis]|uniref:Uncharacterized protein n=1 Tax=Dioscorea zingiberensis TaxID=325984 RepID=A0A9D5CYM5_9LILI|nr:hypothetical protein J5N97_010565 [Dioscorea zingiberensis]